MIAIPQFFIFTPEAAAFTYAYQLIVNRFGLALKQPL